MAKSLGKYFETYYAGLKEKYGESFNYNQFLDSVKKGGFKITGMSQNFVKENVDFPWLGELEIVTEKIMSIASNPRTHIKFEKEVKNSEKAVKIDNFDIIETLKVPKYWRQKDGRFLPEKVFTDNYETEYAIYENRFLINLIDKMMMFLSSTIADLFEKVKKVNRNFIDSYVPTSDIDIIQDLANFNEFDGKDQNSSKKPRKLIPSDKNTTLLTTKNSPYVDALRRVLQARNTLTHVLSTPFYKAVKKSKPLSDADVHITNMLAGDRSYAPCFTFYRKLLTLLSNKEEEEELIDLNHYHTYVLTNIFKALDELGFANTNKRKDSLVETQKGFANLSEFTLWKGDLYCYIKTHHNDHIDITFELQSNFNKVLNLKGKRTSLVSLDLIPQTTLEYPTDDELTTYFKKKIHTRMNKGGYTNAFVITTVDNTQKDDVIICSPYLYKVDANIKSMLESCLVFSEGDSYVYSHLCPVCGYYVDGEQEDGNCYCTNCESVYSLLPTKDKEGKVKESVWIKRLKNPEEF